MGLFDFSAPHPLLLGIALALLAGLSITVGAWLAGRAWVKNALIAKEIEHSVLAFGGGALIAAIAFVLIPHSIEAQSKFSALASFALGGVSFMVMDYVLHRMHTALSQFMAMMLDFIPEAMLLGAVIAAGELKTALFVAAIIAAQNLPEGYMAYKEHMAGHKAPPRMRGFLIVGLSGPLFLLLGTHILTDHPTSLAMLMTFCAGGILYLVFQDIAPRAAMQTRYLPALGSLGGFMVGFGGYLYVG